MPRKIDAQSIDLPRPPAVSEPADRVQRVIAHELIEHLTAAFPLLDGLDVYQKIVNDQISIRPETAEPGFNRKGRIQ
ncbi:MAG: hypothetical protein WBE92_06250 [Steroidobacteraceae bacterium]